eukprot:1893418-Amphidinium_carterae.1
MTLKSEGKELHHHSPVVPLGESIFPWETLRGPHIVSANALGAQDYLGSDFGILRVIKFSVEIQKQSVTLEPNFDKWSKHAESH